MQAAIRFKLTVIIWSIQTKSNGNFKRLFSRFLVYLVDALKLLIVHHRHGDARFAAAHMGRKQSIVLAVIGTVFPVFKNIFHNKPDVFFIFIVKTRFYSVVNVFVSKIIYLFFNLPFAPIRMSKLVEFR